ncbi:hypothetical protein STENM223S_10883 [Streptomyces tendae]
MGVAVVPHAVPFDAARDVFPEFRDEVDRFASLLESEHGEWEYATKALRLVRPGHDLLLHHRLNRRPRAPDPPAGPAPRAQRTWKAVETPSIDEIVPPRLFASPW